MADRDEYVPESLIRALRRGVRGFDRLQPVHQSRMAYLVWINGQSRHDHRLYEGYKTFTYQELDRRFGRGGFKKINKELKIFDVTPGWSKEHGATRGYKLTDNVHALKDQYLRPRRIAITRLMTMDGRAVRTLPAAISSKGLNGVTATAWRNAKVLNSIPVDIAWMKKAHAWMSRAMEGTDTSDLFVKADHDELDYRVQILSQLLKISYTDVAGRGFIVHRYAEASTGRLYAKGVSLQTAPRVIRKAALNGLYEYDIENCHYSVFSQMSSRYGVECAAINRYLSDKQATRQRVADAVGIHIEQAKTCLLALMYGARQSIRPENAIPEAIGVGKAKKLYTEPTFAAIARELLEGRAAILKAWPRRRKTILNAMCKAIALGAPAEERLAHLIQGVEAKALRAIVDLYPDEVVLLMHDGFVAERSLDVPLMERKMFDATGYRMTISCGVIHIPADFDFSKV